MEKLKTLGKLFALVALGIVLGVIIFFFAFWIFVAFLGAIGLLSALWVIGVPITIKEKGVKTGYIRWFTFYPVNQI